MFRRLITGLSRLEDLTLVTILTAMILLAIGQVVLRNIWGSGFVWADPLLRILVLWIALLGAMAATRDRNHISIDVLSKCLPDYLKKPSQFCTHLFTSVICALLSWQGLRLVLMDFREATLAFASVPAWVCELIIPFGFCVISLRFFLYALSALFDREPSRC
ncbi:MAG: TRAP transporter small permease [Methylicorpusculum sp.]|uniref:TRAP transporter small permease n=1 Tax=Methylicorpusculum sp. TaxID=2713644 RepID=UPI00271999D5|nr:TRAP transporter small permease [Methylicorpusculum sp.]MDO8939600.1 TRAP transporter small permease [Methylicorpusculum sp.]MDO9239298.1 TRAP transporter small permease [Methylicorpusculum sp.]MDP2180645.1 TRAP transporter small permease [Methylicorpusculum sp.]MDP2203686.1 TRAP transporter small permease [Methylicorpusculum sp.]MDP3530436.1 TRAP transporter small permease [Methylicorpusculum sp.]